MTIQTIRFRGPGVATEYLREEVDPSATVAYVEGGAMVDVSVDDTDPGAVTQLTETMARLGFTPGTSITCGRLRQTQFVEVTTDVATSSPVFATLLSQSITTSDGGLLVVHFTAAASQATSSAEAVFRLRVDGASQRGGGFTAPSGGAQRGSVALVCRCNVAPGVHVVDVQWATSAGTLSIRPVTNPDGESSALLVEEIEA